LPRRAPRPGHRGGVRPQPPLGRPGAIRRRPGPHPGAAGRGPALPPPGAGSPGGRRRSLHLSGPDRFPPPRATPDGEHTVDGRGQTVKMRFMTEPLRFHHDAQLELQQHFGLSTFRPGQAQVIDSVLAGRNVVVVMPTGAGKSLCYELPAVMLKGLTLVVSPLIALMKDQLEQLEARGIPATVINSAVPELERAERIRKLRAGAYRLVYVAPERFRSPSFVDALAEVGVDLLAIDEAPCISQGGTASRPDCAPRGQIRSRLRPPRTVALTAPATPEVREDIVRSLLMKDPRVFVAGFDRPNLFLEVLRVSGDEERRATCARVLAGGGGGIVFRATRDQGDAREAALPGRGPGPVPYHPGVGDAAPRG